MDDCFDEKIRQRERFDLVVAQENTGQRLDQFLAQTGIEKIKQLSRSMFKNLIGKGDVLVNEMTTKASCRLKSNDRITVFIPPPEPVDLVPEKVYFEIVFEDPDIIVISKPPNLVVHPACGHQNGTLVHGLLYHCSDLGGINGTTRPGIIHRLDKDTSGLMVVAKNDHALGRMVEQFKAKTVQKIYLALVCGVPKVQGGTISGNIGRHPVHRKKMAVLAHGGRESVTHWSLLEEFHRYSLIKLQLETGRTHQIRVHMASIGLPVAGDEVYGKKKIEDQSLGIRRQFLHASTLTFVHPTTGKKVEFFAPLWPDPEKSLSALRKQKGAGGI